MRRLLKSNWLRFVVLTAATSVAAVFISLHFFSTDLLFFLLNKRISFLELSGKTIHLIRLSKDEIGLDLISDKSGIILSSRWTPHLSLFRMQAILSGQVGYLDHDIAVNVEIPLHFSSDPLHELHLKLHGTLQEMKWNVHGILSRTSDQWEGTLHTQLVHSVWGEFAPDIYLKWQKTAQVVLSLLPSNIKSRFLQADQEIQLKVDWDQGLLKSSLNAEAVSLLFSDRKVRIKQLSFELNNQADRTAYLVRGQIPTVSLTPPISKNLKDFFLIARLNGTVNLTTTQGLVLSIQGQIQDSINSLAVRFSVKGPSTQPQFQAKFEGELFEGSSIDSAIKDFFPSTKLLSGKFRGSLSNQMLQAELEPSSLVFGNYLVTGLHSSLEGNIQKRLILVRETNLEVADGSVSIAPFQIAVEKPGAQLAFRADNLDLNKILSGYPKSKLSGTGRFKGSGHLTLRTPELFLSSLHFENSTPGTISYADPSQPYFEKKIIYLNEFQDLLAQGQQALVFKALENFHYSRVKLQAERQSAEQMKVLLNLKGKNPDLAKGQPFDITFPIEGEIASLVQGSLLQQPVTDELNKRSLETE